MKRVLGAAVMAGSLLSGTAGAVEVKVLTAGAYKPVLLDLQPVFEQSGDRLVVSNDTAGGLAKRVDSGEAFDVLIVTDAGIKTQASKGRIVADSPRNVARVGVGVAVRAGTPLPAIGTLDAFKATILAAPSVAYIDPAAGGSSGIYLSGLFDRLGIGAAVKPKAVLVQGGLVADKVASGEAAIGLQQVSELMVVPGVTVVGPLPNEVQNYTVYAAGLSAAAAQPAAARRLLELMSSDAARAVLARRGMEAP